MSNDIVKLSDGIEYFRKPPSGGVRTPAKGSKVTAWYDDDENIWEPIKINGQGMFWRRKTN